MRAISAPTRAARFSKFSGQFPRPDLELLVMRSQSVEVLFPLVGRCRIARGSSGQCIVKMIFGFLIERV
jgi:hypothetical protein